MKIKAGVAPRSLILMAAVANVAQTLTRPRQVVITSGRDGRHKPGSKHGTDEALDVRTKTFPSLAAKRRFAAAIRARLGSGYDVILEALGTSNEHLHIEYDP